MNAWAATVLSMRGEDDDGVVLQLVSGTPNLSFEEVSKDGSNLRFRFNCSADSNEGQGMKLVKEDTGAGMRSLYFKVLGIMPMSVIAASIHRSYHQLETLKLEPEHNVAS
ncbi:uncharacterized protein LOC103975986 [Musa acuminata AAA Group]|uniref:(wild Malaysian banana) hypothetical protein n=1 Tax=Musa acuminata subsp. malaccensis TaxID=214687 RepID=A0A804I1F2_MUSAM|nr:PREDICTED: uncharacterized protein LOC103975986 [Musa acuminata subsp. malaccensis]CAG1861690.1 unnamed protein product [Musa acuminata subsp. malaccensis]